MSYKVGKKTRRRTKRGGGEYYDFSTEKKYNFDTGIIGNLRTLYNNATDEEIQDAKMGNNEEKNIPHLKPLNFAVLGVAKRDMGYIYGEDSKLVGVRGDGLGSSWDKYANLEAPVFWTNRIEGQKDGAFWTFEDDPSKRTFMHTTWINVKPILEGKDDKGNDKPMTRKVEGKEVYLFEWAANPGDSTAKTIVSAIKGPNMGGGIKKTRRRTKRGGRKIRRKTNKRRSRK